MVVNMATGPFQSEDLFALTDLDIPAKCLSFLCFSAHKDGQLVIVNKDDKQVVIVDTVNRGKNVLENIVVDHASLDMDRKTLACYRTPG